MYPRLNFTDVVTFFATTTNDYGQDVLGAETDVSGLFVQSTGYQHNNHQDSVTSGSFLYLPADNNFVKDNAFRLEGMVVRINLFGGENGKQYFRIVSASPGRDILTNGIVRHIECQLEKTTDFDNEAT